MPVCPVRFRLGLHLQGEEGPHQSLGEGYRGGLVLTSDVLLSYYVKQGALYRKLLVVVPREPWRYPVGCLEDVYSKERTGSDRGQGRRLELLPAL